MIHYVSRRCINILLTVEHIFNVKLSGSTIPTKSHPQKKTRHELFFVPFGRPYYDKTTECNKFHILSGKTLLVFFFFFCRTLLTPVLVHQKPNKVHVILYFYLETSALHRIKRMILTPYLLDYVITNSYPVIEQAQSIYYIHCNVWLQRRTVYFIVQCAVSTRD